MINKIKYNGELIIGFEKRGRFNYGIQDNGNLVRLTLIRANKIQISCNVCGKWVTLKYRKPLIDKKYECQSCTKKGEKNPFYGKKHTIETKESLRDSTIGKYSGEKNPFYGKKHTEKTRKHLSKKLTEYHETNDNPFYGKKHTKSSRRKMSKFQKEFHKNLSEEEKNRRREMASKNQKRLMENDLHAYTEMKRRAGLMAAKSNKKYKINNLETYFKENILSVFDEKFEYSVILGYHQYDFGNKENKILIEVHGDYWHGNPKFYGDGDDLKPLNETQIKKQNKDKIKQDFAVSHGFKLLHFWEYDIYNDTDKIILEIKQCLKK